VNTTAHPATVTAVVSLSITAINLRCTLFEATKYYKSHSSPSNSDASITLTGHKFSARTNVVDRTAVLREVEKQTLSKNTKKTFLQHRRVR
jgi:hypothetical protein